jgi:hypothetical protein
LIVWEARLKKKRKYFWWFCFVAVVEGQHGANQKEGSISGWACPDVLALCSQVVSFSFQ